MKLTLKNLSMAIMMSTIVMGSSAMAADSNEKIVIAHRGASGYLPEHTLPAKAMAYAQGADYLEQDLVMTKDDHLVVLHDHYLDRVTDVADRFPERDLRSTTRVPGGSDSSRRISSPGFAMLPVRSDTISILIPSGSGAPKIRTVTV